MSMRNEEEVVVKTRKRTKNRQATTDYREDVEGILYRVGGATVDQVGALLWHMYPDRWSTSGGGAYEAAKKTLRVMREESLAEVVGLRRTWMGKVNGRPESFYRLKKGSEGITNGAHAVGAAGDKATFNYRRVWSGGGVPHAALRVDYLLCLLDGAEVAGVDIDPESAWSETCPRYPLVGAKLVYADAAGKKLDAKTNARRVYERVVPDGEVEIAFDGIPCPVYFEIERRTSAAIVADKIERYAGRWLRVLKDEGVIEARPIIVVHHDERRARRANPREGTGAPVMRAALRDILFGGSRRFAELQRTLKSRDPYASLGRMMLVADFHDVLREGALGRVYHSVSPYSERKGGTLIELRAAAEERDRLQAAYQGGGG